MGHNEDQNLFTTEMIFELTVAVSIDCTSVINPAVIAEEPLSVRRSGRLVGSMIITVCNNQQFFCPSVVRMLCWVCCNQNGWALAGSVVLIGTGRGGLG